MWAMNSFCVSCELICVTYEFIVWSVNLYVWPNQRDPTSACKPIMEKKINILFKSKFQASLKKRLSQEVRRMDLITHIMLVSYVASSAVSFE